MLSVSPHRRREHKEACAWIFPDFYLSISLTDSIAYLFIVINLSHYTPYMLSSSNESPNVGEVLESLNT